MPYTVHHKISELIIKHLRGEISQEERTELDAWIEASPENKALYQELTTEETLAKEVKDINGIRSRILGSIHKQVPELSPVIPMYRRKVFRWVAAACIILVMGYGLWVTSERKATRQQGNEATAIHDVPAPKETRAVITLANGSKVYLDSASNGTIAQENNVNVVKNANGGISYLSPAGGGDLNESPNNKRPGVDYNTLFNPRGSKVISLTLSDGTKVWLNSESSLKYPIAFNGNSREVEITGEAYFEVKHNSKQPFKVHLPNGSIVEDIGTSFNVNAYTDEADIKTTLIEGSVRISYGSPDHPITKSQILKPGEQSVINRSSPDHQITRSPNIDEVMAWKNGRFSFDGADIKTIMRQISRWYDVDVQYDAEIKSSFVAKISRDVPVSQLLKIMELTDLVHFKIEGKKITVLK
jgi:ferric-dicitrate binding protein FerR (iron transport regulator)